MKKIIALTLTIASMLTFAACKGNEGISARETYHIDIDMQTSIEREISDLLYIKGNNAIAFFDASELTTEILEARTPEVVIVDCDIEDLSSLKKAKDIFICSSIENQKIEIKKFICHKIKLYN